jgi:GT2 family glycosyltransferase
MKAETIRRLGGLDERFELGLFDDDDLCLRFWREGYKVCVAKDVYVHHFGSMTFRNLGVDTARLYRENRIRFEEKWLGKGSAVPSSSRVFEHGGAEIEATTYVDALWLCRRPFGEK